MKMFPKSKKLRIAIAIFFLSGLILGTTCGYYWGKNTRRARMAPGEFKRYLHEKTVSELELTPEQEKQITPILERKFEKINQIRTQSSGELIKTVAASYDEMKVFLKTEQQPKLEAMKQRSVTRLQEKIREKL